MGCGFSQENEDNRMKLLKLLVRLLRCLVGKHAPIAFTDGERTVVLCKICLKRLWGYK